MAPTRSPGNDAMNPAPSDAMAGDNDDDDDENSPFVTPKKAQTRRASVGASGGGGGSALGALFGGADSVLSPGYEHTLCTTTSITAASNNERVGE
jgi:hypothetical protein